MSLPSCMPQDQDFVQGHAPNVGLPISLRTNPKRLDRYQSDDDRRKLRTNYLQLTPVETACASLNALDVDKGKFFFSFFFFLFFSSFSRKTYVHMCFRFISKSTDLESHAIHGARIETRTSERTDIHRKHALRQTVDSDRIRIASYSQRQS